MTADQQERMVEVQLQDVAEMQYIYEATARGKSPSEACGEVLGGQFELSPHVASGIEAGSIMNLSSHNAEVVDHLSKLNTLLNNDSVIEAGRDWLRGEIYQMKVDLGI